MKRRRLFKGVAGISLVLCALTVPAWLLSRWLVVAVSYIRMDPPADAPSRLQNSFIAVGRGGIEMGAMTLMPLNAADAVHWAGPTPDPRGISFYYQWLDFRRSRWRWDGSVREIGPLVSFNGVQSNASGMQVYVPYWMITLALAIPPGLQLMRWQAHRRRARKGLCPTCGYDLRATPDRCPECGTVPERTIATSGLKSRGDEETRRTPDMRPNSGLPPR